MSHKDAWVLRSSYAVFITALHKWELCQPTEIYIHINYGVVRRATSTLVIQSLSHETVSSSKTSAHVFWDFTLCRWVNCSPPFRRNVVPSTSAYRHPNKRLNGSLNCLYQLYKRIMIIRNVGNCLTDGTHNISEDLNFSGSPL
jgi:hypothetical protein